MIQLYFGSTTMNAVDSSSTKIVAMLLCGGMSNSPRGKGCDLWCGVVWWQFGGRFGLEALEPFGSSLK